MYFVSIKWDYLDFDTDSFHVERSSGDFNDESSYEFLTSISNVFFHNTCENKYIENETDTIYCYEPSFGLDNIDGELFFMGKDTIENKTYILDNWIDHNTTYHYRVVPYNILGEPEQVSQILTVTTLDQPAVELTSPSAAQIWESGMDIPVEWSYTGSGGAFIGAVSLAYSGGQHSSDHCVETATDASTGSDASGNSSSTCAISGTSFQADHGQEVLITIEDIGDYYGNNRGSYGSSSGSFTTSETELTHGYFYQGWHVFGSPLDAAAGNPLSVADLLSLGMPGSYYGADYVYFDQDGNFGLDIFYNFGTAYFLGLQSDLVSFEVSGNLLTSDGEIEAGADHQLQLGWNLISPKLVRSIGIGNFIVSDGNQYFTWAEAQEYGLVAGLVIGSNENGYFESQSFDPFNGYWIHTSRAVDLIVRPHSFDDFEYNNILDWTLMFHAQPINNQGTGDIIKIGMDSNGIDGFRYGEDSYDIPLGMDAHYINLYMHRNWVGEEDVNGIVAQSNTYYSDIREFISPEQFQIFDIQSTITNITSDIRLSWNMDEIDESYNVILFINGEWYDMKTQNELIINSENLNILFIGVGNPDPPLTINKIFEYQHFHLSPSYPNPFNPNTNINYYLPHITEISLIIYDIEGRKIISLENGIKSAGNHTIEWNADGYPSGVYFVKLNAGEFTQTQKLMLVK